MLRAELIGRIGCVSEGRVYVVPITYDGEAVYAHTTAPSFRCRATEAVDGADRVLVPGLPGASEMLRPHALVGPLRTYASRPLSRSRR